MIETLPAFRAEDLLGLNVPGKGVEIIEGELIVMTPPDWSHNKIVFQFQLLFYQFCQSHPGFDCGYDNDGFLLQRNKDVLLCPDASLFRIRPQPSRPWRDFSPEIAVEVVSPSNNPSEIAYKRSKYFDAGSEQVWIARPETEMLEFHFPDGRLIKFHGAEIASGEGIADGMTIDLQALFLTK